MPTHVMRSLQLPASQSHYKPQKLAGTGDKNLLLLVHKRSRSPGSSSMPCSWKGPTASRRQPGQDRSLLPKSPRAPAAPAPSSTFPRVAKPRLAASAHSTYEEPALLFTDEKESAIKANPTQIPGVPRAREQSSALPWCDPVGEGVRREQS